MINNPYNNNGKLLNNKILSFSTERSMSAEKFQHNEIPPRSSFGMTKSIIFSIKTVTIS